MLRHNKSFYLLVVVIIAGLSSCKKEEYSFGDIKTPVNLTLKATIVGVDGANPNGDGSGKVIVEATGDEVVTYKINFGNGTDSAFTTSGTIEHTYKDAGTNNFTITVRAIGTGGVSSTITTNITLFVNFTIPPEMIKAFTDSTSRIWVTDKNAVGHFGVGPNNEFLPIWYAAPPLTREACAYDDEITFTLNPLGTISMSINSNGTSFSTGAATGFYGFSGGDGCYAINTGGTRLLSFMSASSASTAAQSTRIQFVVPGNGIINFGTGGTAYEIISFSNDQIFIRNIGTDTNAWYQKLKPL
ncbi:MAG: PKD domain-containing protein [Rhizobacter sp.]|nr:PKD domain-containing protein [Ferruginibacter sp.]